MKSKIYFLVLFILAPLILNARVIDRFGAKIAISASKVTAADFENFFNRRIGFNLGVFGEKNITNYIAFVSSVEYNQKGYISEMIATSEDGKEIQKVDSNTRLDYLSVPVLAKFKYSKICIEPFVAIGPRFEYMLNYKKGEFKFMKITVKDNMADNFNRFSYGGSIAGGINIPISNKFKLNLEFRYNYDFSDLASKPNTIEFKNDSFDLWLQFSF
ncbi:MAG TPA: porin family protein [bacterium]